MTVDCSVIVVSWNVRELLARCLESVQESLAGAPFSAEIIVVDNDSRDGSAALVAERFPAATLVQTGANLGYAGGANAGIERAGGRWLFVLNPDTELVGAALPVLLAFAERHPGAVVAGPQLRYPDGAIQSSRRRFPTPLTYFAESTLLGRWLPGNRWARRYHMADQPADQAQRVDWLVGAALLVRSATVAAVGPLDPAFWMYSEELEWQRRLGRRGAIWYVPEAVVIHHEGRSSEQAPARKHLAFQRSKLRYANLHDGPLLATLLHLFLIVSYGLDWLAEAAKWLAGHKRPLRRQRLAVYGAVLRRLAGGALREI